MTGDCIFNKPSTDVDGQDVGFSIWSFFAPLNI